MASQVLYMMGATVFFPMQKENTSAWELDPTDKNLYRIEYSILHGCILTISVSIVKYLPNSDH